jgi:protease-4
MYHARLENDELNRRIFMKRVIIGVLAILGLLSILAVMGIGLLGFLSFLGKPGVPASTILEVNFERGAVETIPDDPVAEVMLKGSLPVRDVVDALEKAAEDRRVEAFVAKIGAGGMGIAHVQEIRDAVLRFRESGKPAIAWAETFGEFGPGNGGYYLATAFDEIYLQPSGDIGLTGLMYEGVFIRGTLDKLGVVPRMDQRFEYKNAMNMYTERSFTEPHREAMERMMISQFEQMLDGIAEGRGITVDQAQDLVDRGPFLASEALEAGLVDGLAYRDEVTQKVRESAGEKARLLFLAKYLERAGRPHGRGDTVALVHGYGAVTRGSSGYSPLTGTVTMGSDTVAGALRTAIDDDRVKAILFRVDSPGGSYVASDTIWRETLRAKKAGKPVVISMGNLAASGGYFVAMHADRIVAQPGTITGSIGVLGGKMLTTGLWEKLGISWDDVHSSANSTQWTGLHDYTESGYERFQASLDRIYDDFTSKVAEGRSLELEEVRRIAKGRIWSGEDALELGLVDALGGYDVALGQVRELLELEADAPLKVKLFPRKRGALEALLGEEAESSESAAMATLAQVLRTIQPTVRLLHRMGLTGEQEALLMPPVAPAHP